MATSDGRKVGIEVILNVYDLHEYNSWLYKLGLGIFHSGVQLRAYHPPSTQTESHDTSVTPLTRSPRSQTAKSIADEVEMALREEESLQLPPPSPNLLDMPISKAGAGMATNASAQSSHSNLLYSLNVEYGYGGNPYSESTGVFHNMPRMAPGSAMFRRSLQCGVAEISVAELETILDRFRSKYLAKEYHVLYQNCNDFSNDLVLELLGTPIPLWINRTAYIATFCECCLPDKIIHPLDYMDPSIFFQSLSTIVVATPPLPMHPHRVAHITADAHRIEHSSCSSSGQSRTNTRKNTDSAVVPWSDVKSGHVTVAISPKTDSKTQLLAELRHSIDDQKHNHTNSAAFSANGASVATNANHFNYGSISFNNPYRQTQSQITKQLQMNGGGTTNPNKQKQKKQYSLFKSQKKNGKHYSNHSHSHSHSYSQSLSLSNHITNDHLSAMMVPLDKLMAPSSFVSDGGAADFSTINTLYNHTNSADAITTATNTAAALPTATAGHVAGDGLSIDMDTESSDYEMSSDEHDQLLENYVREQFFSANSDHRDRRQSQRGVTYQRFGTQ